MTKQDMHINITLSWNGKENKTPHPLNDRMEEVCSLCSQIIEAQAN